MKTVYRVGYKDLENAARENGYQLIDTIEGCLVDSVLYEKPGKPGYQSILIAGFETYLNSWSSCLTVYIARTERDRARLWDKWSKAQEAAETEENAV